MNVEDADQSLTEARTNMSDLVQAVRLLGRMYFLTSRKTRHAAIIPVELAELIERVGGPKAAEAILEAARPANS